MAPHTPGLYMCYDAYLRLSSESNDGKTMSHIGFRLEVADYMHFQAAFGICWPSKITNPQVC